MASEGHGRQVARKRAALEGDMGTHATFSYPKKGVKNAENEKKSKKKEIFCAIIGAN
ncbi:MAG: hypothetical protein II462_05625 [Muribaculaceae bacterium]|nr:hypothetical protein [Muribaculaceae bacterium]